MDFKNLNGVVVEKILYNLYRIDFKIFVQVSFVLSLDFSLILIFRCIKPISSGAKSEKSLSFLDCSTPLT